MSEIGTLLEEYLLLMRERCQLAMVGRRLAALKAELLERGPSPDLLRRCEKLQAELQDEHRNATLH